MLKSIAAIVLITSAFFTTNTNAAFSGCTIESKDQWGDIRTVAENHKVVLKRITYCHEGQYPIYYGIAPFHFTDLDFSKAEEFLFDIYNNNGNKPFTYVDMQFHVVAFIVPDEEDGRLTVRFSNY